MNYNTSNQTNIDLVRHIMSSVTGLTNLRSSFHASPPVYSNKDDDWSIAPFEEEHELFLSQPLILVSNTSNAQVLSIMSGALFYRKNKLQLKVSEINMNNELWSPYPSPIFSHYNDLLENVHIRPVPALFTYEAFSIENDQESILYDKIADGYIRAVKLSFCIRYIERLVHEFGIALLGLFLFENNSSRTLDELVSNVSNTISVLTLRDVIKDIVVYDTLNGNIDEIDYNSINDLEGFLDLLVPNRDDPSSEDDLTSLIGIKVYCQTPLMQLDSMDVLSIRSFDWRCYGHPFEPLAILRSRYKDESGEYQNVGSKSQYDGIYLRNDLSENMPSTIPSNTDNYYTGSIEDDGGFNETIATGDWNTAYDETRIRIKSIAKKELAANSVIMKDTSGNLIEVELDKYEKWSIFPSNIRIIYSHWFVSGFLNENKSDRVILRIIAQVFRASAGHLLPADDNNVYFYKPYAIKQDEENGPYLFKNSIASSRFNGMDNYIKDIEGESILLPSPVDYSSILASNDYDLARINKGVEEGKKRRTMHYDMALYKIDFHDKHTADYFAKKKIRPYNSDASIKPFYKGRLGAYGLEEYVSRVPLKEIPNILSGYETRTATSLKEITGDAFYYSAEILKAKIIICRNYVMGRTFTNTYFNYNYDPFKIYTTGDHYQEFTLSFYNTAVRFLYSKNGSLHSDSSEKVRLVIEDAMYETWGQVLMHKGVVTETLYKSARDDSGSKPGVRSSAYEGPLSDDQYSDQRRVYTLWDHGGPGLGQNGAKDLLLYAGASAHQILHWYFYGDQIVNAWGQGDYVSSFPNPFPHVDPPPMTEPNSENAFPWLVWQSEAISGDRVPLPSLQFSSVLDLFWALMDSNDDIIPVDLPPGDFRSDGRIWRVSMNFKNKDFDSSKFIEGSSETSYFLISKNLVQMLERLRQDLGVPLYVLKRTDYSSYDFDITKLSPNLDYPSTSLGSLISSTHSNTSSKNSIKAKFDSIVPSDGKIDVIGGVQRLIYKEGKGTISEHDLNKRFSTWIELRREDTKHYYYLVRDTTIFG